MIQVVIYGHFRHSRTRGIRILIGFRSSFRRPEMHRRFMRGGWPRKPGMLTGFAVGTDPDRLCSAGFYSNFGLDSLWYDIFNKTPMQRIPRQQPGIRVLHAVTGTGSPRKVLKRRVQGVNADLRRLRRRDDRRADPTRIDCSPYGGRRRHQWTEVTAPACIRTLSKLSRTARFRPYPANLSA